MPEGIGTVKHWRAHGAEQLKLMATNEQVPHKRLAAGNQLIGEHVPGACLEPPGSEQAANTIPLRRASLQVILQDDGLPIEEERLPFTGWLREQIIDKVDEADPEFLSRSIPLAIPVGVRNKMNLERHGSACGPRVDASKSGRGE
jgi:hypothetical protein